jgi:hypothetical protein
VALGGGLIVPAAVWWAALALWLVAVLLLDFNAHLMELYAHL